MKEKKTTALKSSKTFCPFISSQNKVANTVGSTMFANQKTTTSVCSPGVARARFIIKSKHYMAHSLFNYNLEHLNVKSESKSHFFFFFFFFFLLYSQEVRKVYHSNNFREGRVVTLAK